MRSLETDVARLHTSSSRLSTVPFRQRAAPPPLREEARCAGRSVFTNHLPWAAPVRYARYIHASSRRPYMHSRAGGARQAPHARPPPPALRLRKGVVYPLRLRSALCGRSFESRDDECWRLHSRAALRARHLPAGGRHLARPRTAHSAHHGARRATRPVYGPGPWRRRAGELWRALGGSRVAHARPLALALRRDREQPPGLQAATRSRS